MTLVHGGQWPSSLLPPKCFCERRELRKGKGDSRRDGLVFALGVKRSFASSVSNDRKNKNNIPCLTCLPHAEIHAHAFSCWVSGRQGTCVVHTYRWRNQSPRGTRGHLFNDKSKPNPERPESRRWAPPSPRLQHCSALSLTHEPSPSISSKYHVPRDVW